MSNDMVNSPPHYQGEYKDIECIDCIRAMLGRDGFIAFIRGQIIRYNWRVLNKQNPVQDAQKLAWYANKLEEVLKEGMSNEART